MKSNRIVAMALCALFAGAARGQETPKLDKREANQEKRIEQGKESGQLNQREANRLEAREDKLKSDEAAAKADGKVTKKERAHLQHEANRDSKHIYKQKHDAQTKH